MTAVPHLRLIKPGYCHCGCGEKTPVVKWNDAYKGLVRGEPRKYIAGHVHRINGPDYLEEDRGHDTPCWVWQKTLTTHGYACLSFGKTVRRLVHIVNYERVHGYVPEGLELDHLCRVRACVNSAHLEPVTRAENVRRGMRTVLTADDVREMRRLLAAGMTQREAATRFGVSKGNVSHIATYRSWEDVA